MMDLLCNGGIFFGFGPEASSTTDTFKVSTATEEKMEKLNKTSTHNLRPSLGEERSVGHINNELGMRG